ncbi:MAG: PadR family transcriptional regulator [Propionibacteriaceae bacterium]
MKLEHLLLGVLLGHPSTGYDLKKYLDAHGRFLRPNTQMSQIYRCLGELDDRGWVAYREEPRPGSTNPKIYSATTEGSAAFLTWLNGPYRPPSAFYDPEFRARLYFSGFLSREVFLDFLETEMANRKQQVLRSRNRDRTLPRDPVIPFDAELADAIAEEMHWFDAANMDAHIAWVERIAEALRSGRLFAHEESWDDHGDADNTRRRMASPAGLDRDADPTGLCL